MSRTKIEVNVLQVHDQAEVQPRKPGSPTKTAIMTVKRVPTLILDFLNTDITIIEAIIGVAISGPRSARRLILGRNTPKQAAA